MIRIFIAQLSTDHVRSVTKLGSYFLKVICFRYCHPQSNELLQFLLLFSLKLKDLFYCLNTYLTLYIYLLCVESLNICI